MTVRFHVTIESTSYEWSNIYLWATETRFWLIFPIPFFEIIASKHVVPNERAEQTAKELLQNADALYAKWLAKPRGIRTRS